MECIIKGKRVDVDKNECLNNVGKWTEETLAQPVPETRRVIDSIDKLGRYMIENEEFLLPELIEHTSSVKNKFWLEEAGNTNFWQLIIIENGSFTFEMAGKTENLLTG